MYAIVKSTQLDELCRNGVQADARQLSVGVPSLTTPAPSILVLTSHGNLHGPPLDILLICVKSTSTLTIAHQLPQLYANGTIDKDTVLISLQNGVGNLDILTPFCSTPNVIVQGVTYMGASSLQVGSFRAGGTGATVVGGSMSSMVQHKLEQFKQTMARAQLECSLVEPSQIKSIVWSKLIVNAAINPVATLLDGPNGQTVATSAARRVVRSLVNESVQVAMAHEIPLHFKVGTVPPTAVTTVDPSIRTTNPLKPYVRWRKTRTTMCAPC